MVRSPQYACTAPQLDRYHVFVALALFPDVDLLASACDPKFLGVALRINLLIIFVLFATSLQLLGALLRTPAFLGNRTRAAVVLGQW